jgi:hypothetical protein
MLVAAVALVLAVHVRGLPGWVRPNVRRGPKRRGRRKSTLRIVESEPDDDFVAAVERDLAALPTIDDRD